MTKFVFMLFRMKMSPRCQDIVSKSVQIGFACPAVYQLQPKKETMGSLTRITVGEKRMNNINRTVLLVGETGTGKSTLVNALVNYAMGVKWEHKVWYEIVERKIQEEGEQSESLTSDVIVYELFGLEDETLPYSLTLIDTPGFGDTRGTERDFIISQQLFELFQCENGVHELNVVALVLKASDNRLSDRLMYVFHSVMSLFGKDMAENIVALITNSNGLEPTCALNALKAAGIKCARNDKKLPRNFLFDNYQPIDRTEETEDLLKHAYNMSVKGMESLTAFLEKTKPQNLEQTVKVLNGSIRLAACVQNLQERIALTEITQTEIKETREAVKKYEKEMIKNKNLTVTVNKVIRDSKNMLKISMFYYKLGITAICCNVCKENCQLICFTDVNKSVTMENGKCTSCTNKCPASHHEKTHRVYVTKIRKVQMTLEEIKEKYDMNKIRAECKNSVLIFLEQEMRDLTAKRLHLLEEALNHVFELHEINLNVNSISTHAYLDFLIERMEEKGDTEKVQRLRDMRSRQDKKVQAALEYMFHKTTAICKRT